MDQCHFSYQVFKWQNVNRTKYYKNHVVGCTHIYRKISNIWEIFHKNIWICHLREPNYIIVVIRA